MKHFFLLAVLVALTFSLGCGDGGENSVIQNTADANAAAIAEDEAMEAEAQEEEVDLAAERAAAKSSADSGSNPDP